MSGMNLQFTYKCSKGHEESQIFPAGTDVEDHSEIICQECLRAGERKRAFIVMSKTMPRDKK